MKKKNNKAEKRKEDFPRASASVAAYQSVTDPLGSYSGLTTDMHPMPRKHVDGKIFMKLEDIPTQDADDL